MYLSTDLSCFIFDEQTEQKGINLRITANYKGNFNIENELIGKYCPLLNDTHNPMRLQGLKDDKDKCRKIARE